VLGVAVLQAGSLAGQEPVRAYLVGDPLPGQDAPAFELPYVTSEGPGPADQPFAVRAELARVVVLAFCRTAADTATVTLLRELAGRGPELFPGEVVVAAVLPQGASRLAALASDERVGFKLLADSSGAVRRRYGVDQREFAVYVINPSGRIRWRDLRFNPFLATSYDRLGAEVRAAWGPSGR